MPSCLTANPDTVCPLANPPAFDFSTELKRRTGSCWFASIWHFTALLFLAALPPLCSGCHILLEAAQVPQYGLPPKQSL